MSIIPIKQYMPKCKMSVSFKHCNYASSHKHEKYYNFFLEVYISRTGYQKTNKQNKKRREKRKKKNFKKREDY